MINESMMTCEFLLILLFWPQNHSWNLKTISFFLYTKIFDEKN